MQSCLTLEVVLGLNIQLSICIGRRVTGHDFVDNSLPCPAVEAEAATIQKVQLIMQTAATVQLESTGVVFILSVSADTQRYLRYMSLRATWLL